ncbi:MAG: PfkB family carbohydrate kinase [Alphaproteobacteria bacterium]
MPEVRVGDVDVAGTGFAVLDRIYTPGCSSVSEALGGSCGNVLISLAMLRRRVVPILSLGRDETGRRLLEEFSCVGAETRFIHRRSERRSPVLAQLVDPSIGAHSFAWMCPETRQEFPRFEPVDPEDVAEAGPVLDRCAIFYVDRLTEAVAAAMERARAAGAIVFFEPSEKGEAGLFARAVAAASILKFSADRLGADVEPAASAVSVVTHGDAGLEVTSGDERLWLRPFPARDLRDTCGSGDMVSIGLIHWLLAIRPNARSGLDLATVVPGIRAGQRLAAENCGYIGARGLFRQKGPEYARAILED